MVSYFVHYDPLLQNATVHYDPLLQNATDIITKCDSYCILLQNASGFLIAECEFYFKKRQLSQTTMILLQNATIISKWNSYYKIRRYKDNKKNGLRLV